MFLLIGLVPLSIVLIGFGLVIAYMVILHLVIKSGEK